MFEELLSEGERRMHRAVDDLKRDLHTIRTGRASPSILDNVLVEYYGAQTPLQGLAQISVADPRLLVIQPYDRSTIGAIEKAIQKSDLGLNPANDGQVIRLAIPPLTEQRRKELARPVRIVFKSLLRSSTARCMRRSPSESSSSNITHLLPSRSCRAARRARSAQYYRVAD